MAEFTYRSARSGSFVAGICVLLVLREPVQVRLSGGIRKQATRLALHLDDADGFVGHL